MAAKEQLALQQAAAATALLRLNAAEQVWRLFQHQPDPRLCSYLLHRLAAFGVDPGSLLAQLENEPVVLRRRSLILGIGEFAAAGLLSAEQQATASKDLLGWYGDDPDAGTHGAAEWALKQLGKEAEIADIRKAYALGTAVGERQWYLTKEGQHTMMVIHPDAEFLMGSAVSEAERIGGPTGTLEIRHRRQIGRTFAFASHEVTVAQFQAFRDDHDFDRVYAREDNAPANAITWYDAAAYCNWLSDREDLPKAEWCYDPEQPFAEGMTLVPDYLQRTGYRLPSEAEWEYACRSGTTTARYFGETETLLGEYAWYTKTSGDKWMLPVGTLKPNAAGLFDMQGNVAEWCQERAHRFKTDRAWMASNEQLGELSNSQSRVLRGGAFGSGAHGVRSAFRSNTSPGYRNLIIGFRVARTYLIPFTALPPALPCIRRRWIEIVVKPCFHWHEASGERGGRVCL